MRNPHDLAEALRRDDLAEEAGMHANDRVTCWTHQCWAEECASWGHGTPVIAPGSIR
ncbi:hypothetical protein [Streptosporangium saharense]|uniref:Uncharacterized protein n=2 Tax=Streptosporangium TaxID=2000 RepID=A0A7W7QWN3_9ACTN|nr:hypothetical protein [Streptosporangium saharense]MBB4920903.1 hypothetical protein [Streptosporangium saharense]